MIQLIKKADQFNTVMFGDKAKANKPVFLKQENVKPYSNLFYWSNTSVTETSGFGLHPHEGFEIMTFVIKGAIEHHDTKTNVWTPINPGDFQIIQANSGIEHQERVVSGSQAFQIWFDPNFRNAIQLQPDYKDYKAEDFLPQSEMGIEVITYIGDGSNVKVLTPNIKIKKLIFKNQKQINIPLNENASYTLYVLNGKGNIKQGNIERDDVIRISGEENLSINFSGEIFYIETPLLLDYTPYWELK